jgi:ribosomal protein S27AE
MTDDTGGKKPLIINGSLKHVECPYCGGEMFQSRKSMLQGIHVYWQKPWGPTLKMDEAIIPLACVKCGGVILALRDAARVSREWANLSEAEKNAIERE